MTAYFDPAYFDGTYFSVTIAVTGSPGMGWVKKKQWVSGSYRKRFPVTVGIAQHYAQKQPISVTVAEPYSKKQKVSVYVATPTHPAKTYKLRKTLKFKIRDDIDDYFDYALVLNLIDTPQSDDDEDDGEE